MSNFSRQSFPVNALLILTLLLMAYFVVNGNDHHYSQGGLSQSVGHDINSENDSEVDCRTHKGTVLATYIDKTFAHKDHLSLKLNTIVALFLVVFNASMISYISIKQNLYKTQSFIPALLFVITSTIFFEPSSTIRPLLVSSLIMFGSLYIFRSFATKSLSSGTFLQAGFFMGSASVVMPEAILTIFLLITGLVLSSKFDLREWLSSLVGFMIPILGVFYVDWLIRYESVADSLYKMVDYLTPRNFLDPKMFQTIDYLAIFVVLVMAVVGGVKYIRARRSAGKRIGRTFLYFVWMFIFSVTSLMVYDGMSQIALVPIFAVPCSILGAALFTYQTGARIYFWNKLLYSLLIIGSLARWLIAMIYF